VQGPTPSRTVRIGIAAAFAGAFVGGALTIFAIVNVVGTALGFTQLPFEWRVGLAGGGLLSLAAVDLRAIAKSTYCPISWRRQTPRDLLRRYRMTVAASVWGFDTGLIVTTFRVAAVGWGALFLAALGLLPLWAGLGYGLAFTLPFLVLLMRPRLGRSSRDAAPADPGLESMLRRRAAIQGWSAALLITSAGILIGSVLARETDKIKRGEGFRNSISVRAGVAPQRALIKRPQPSLTLTISVTARRKPSSESFSADAVELLQRDGRVDRL
jgi:hypothetical protein